MVADAIVRHEVLMIKSYEAIHCGAVARHVVDLDGAAVVGHCEIMNPFLVCRRGLRERRVAKRVLRRWLLFLGIEISGCVGVSANRDS